MSLLLLFNQSSATPPVPVLGGAIMPRDIRLPRVDYRYKDEEEAIIMLVMKYIEIKERDYVD